MSETKKKPVIDLTKLHYIAEVPERKQKVSVDWLPTLKALIANTNPKHAVLAISESEASIPATRNQIAKCISRNITELTGIIVNMRMVNKEQVMFVSYKKPES